MENHSSLLIEQNEHQYEELVTLLEASQGKFALFIAACDDRKLREQIVQKYERELFPDISTYRLTLNRGEPSLRAAIAQWTDTHQGVLEQKRPVVLTVTGAEDLLWLKLQTDESNKTELDKFFGYLQWTREAIGQFPYPIVLWVTHRILQTMSRKAPDFWSWRNGVFRFASEVVPLPAPGEFANASLSSSAPQETNDHLLPLEDLQELIATTEQQQGTNAPALATLYDQIAQAYVKRIGRGEAENLQKERKLAIEYFEKAIALHAQYGDAVSQMWTLIDLGNFHKSQCQFQDALRCYQDALKIALQIGDRNGEAASLKNLGNVYHSLGQYTQAIEFHRQSLEVDQEIGDRHGEAASLNNLGNAYHSLGQYTQAIEFHQQSLEINQQMGNRHGEAISLKNLGNAYHSLGQYTQAIEFHQQSLEIDRQIGDRSGEGGSLCNLGNIYCKLGEFQRAVSCYRQAIQILSKTGHREFEANSWSGMGNALAKLGQKWDARSAYQKARDLYQEIGLTNQVERIDSRIYHLEQIVPTASVKAPAIEPASRAKPNRKVRQAHWVKFSLWFALGLGLVVLIGWLISR
ncbi:MAG: tetratricopeptide repeat protein [Elainellaceae cyanobacterium]